MAATAALASPADLVARSVAHVAGLVLEQDFPAFPRDRRCATARFVAGRVRALEGPAATGVKWVALLVRVLAALPVGGRRLVEGLARRPMPVVGEYVRLIRSLACAFMWERWPDLRADGSAPDGAVHV